VVLDKGLYKVNTLVDAYNVASLKTVLGMGAMDFDKLALPVQLRLSGKGEKIRLIGGEEKTTKTGELVYADEEKIITLDFNYRYSVLKKITEGTKTALLFVDGCEGISEEEVKGGLKLMVELVTKFCGGRVLEKGVVY
jgi:DNA/RNA-binding domain of Phe-tRNA-synthetase-like protein